MTATLSGSGDKKVQVSFSTGGSCDAKPGDSCSVPYIAPSDAGEVKATASATGTDPGATPATSNEITIKVQTNKDWSSEPALESGELTAKLQKAGVTPPPTEPPVGPPTGDPQGGPVPPPPADKIPAGTRRFAPGSTVSVSVRGASDEDTCTRCGTDEETEADEIKYKWTNGGGDGGAGTDGGAGDEGSSSTVTIPDTVGQSVEVNVEVDDKGEIADGDSGDRDDAATPLTMTLYAATPDPNDPDKDGDGFPESEDPDGDDEPEEPGPTPTPTPNPNPNPTPDPPKVSPGSSQIYWRVLNPKDLQDGTKPSLDGPIGGAVAIQVIINVGRKGRLDPALNRFTTNWENKLIPASTLTFRLHEEEDENQQDDENRVRHAEDKDHADVSVGLNDDAWGVWTSDYADDGSALPPVFQRSFGNAMSANMSNDKNLFYTKTIMWDTIQQMSGGGGTLLGHNGQHSISLVKVNGQTANSLLFQKQLPDDPEWQDAEFEAQETTHNVGNLVITNVTTNQEKAEEIADYFKFDPQSEDDDFVHPKVQFEFDGFDETPSKDRYNWWLYVRATTVEGYSNFLTYEGKVDKPGQVEVSINKELSSYKKTSGNDLNDWGTYAFDVTIQDTKTGDSVRLRTAPEELKTAPRLVDLNDQPFKNADGENIVDEDGKLLPGHELVIEEDDRDVEVPLKFFFSYTLRGKEDASKVKIDLLGPDLKLAATKEGGTEIGEYNYLHLFTANDDVQGSEGSGWKGVLIARDNLGENYRDHKNRSALAVNEEKLNFPLCGLASFTQVMMETLQRRVLIKS